MEFENKNLTFNNYWFHIWYITLSIVKDCILFVYNTILYVTYTYNVYKNLDGDTKVCYTFYVISLFAIVRKDYT